MIPVSRGLAKASGAVRALLPVSLALAVCGSGRGSPSRGETAGAPESAPSYSSVLSVVFAPGEAASLAARTESVPLGAALWNPALRNSLADLGARGIASAFPLLPATPDRGSSRSGNASPPMLDLGRFYHLQFDSPEAALAAAPRISALPSVVLAQPIPDGLAVSEFPDDPYFLASGLYGADAQWCLRNQGLRAGSNACGQAVAGADMRVAEVWSKYFRGGGDPADSARPIGSPSVVLGFLDEGIRPDHPDLHVLSEFSHDARFSLCPDADWCGDHGTKMAGLAAMATDNGIGAAGVCGDCSLLDLRVPACACSLCDNIDTPCLYVHSLWYTKLASALNVPLGLAPDGRPRRLAAVNGSFAGVGVAPLEEVEVLWAAYLAGTLTVAGSGDHSLALPRSVQPANVPFVLGVGGSTWEDRFWDATASCYAGDAGTTIGPGVVDLTAPACGQMLTAFPVDNPGGGGPYAWTSGQCSAATALVTGAAGLIQSYARDGSPLHRELHPDELAGLLIATTRPYRQDPTIGATCPADTCPRAYYGAGIVSLENAFFVLAHADSWKEVFVRVSQGGCVEFLPPPFSDAQGTVWRQYRVTWEFSLPPRPSFPDAPTDLPQYIAWPLKAGSTTLCSYGPIPQRVLYAQAGITDCEVELDRAGGSGRLIGFNFTQEKDGVEIPLVPWDELRAGMVVWSQHLPGEGLPGPAELVADAARRLRLPSVELAGPNPFHGSTRFRVRVRPRAEAAVELIDVSGRVVRTLYAGGSFAGEMTLTWDGKDSRGRAVPAGLYWIRVRSEEKSATRPVVRMP